MSMSQRSSDSVFRVSPETYNVIINVLGGETDLLYHYEAYQEIYELVYRDMPYDVAKGRTGDPLEWINENLHQYDWGLL
jgi:hypothetical protein